jgi:hypothetical protein
MPSQEDAEQIRKQSEQAKDYFSKVAGFEPSKAGQPAPPPVQEEETPAVPARPEPPLTEAEKYFKGLLG